MKDKNKFSQTGYINLFNSSKDSFWSLLFSAIFSVFYVIGFYMDKESIMMQSNKSMIGRVVGAALLFFLILEGGTELYHRFYNFLINRISKEKPEITNGDTRLYFRCLIIVLFMWIPVLLAYYPGLFTYDVAGQIPQMKGSYSTHHPLIHTFILQFFYYVIGERFMGSYTKGMACYTLFQMLILAMAIAYMHLFLYRMKVGRKSRVVILIFTGIFPVYSVLSISITKDIIFTAFYLVLFLCLCYREMMPDFFEKRHMDILYIFSIIGTVLFRNNGIYVIVLLFAVELILLWREKRKKILLSTMIGILISLALLDALKYSVHAANGSPNEMLSIPYQQLSCVYNNKKDELSFADINEIKSIIPNVEGYSLHNADMVKGNALAWEHKSRFVSIYFKMFVKYPNYYIKAFLYNTMGYWYLFDTSNAEIYGVGLEYRQGYLLTDTKEGFDVEHNSHFSILENLYENLFSLNEYQKNPVLFILCSMAFYIWAIVLCVFYAVNLKRKQVVFPAVFLLGYIFTIFAGPCALIRYVFPVISCIPPLYVSVFKSIEKDES